MSRLDNLVANYRRHASLPLRPERSLSQRVWFVVYEPDDERRMLTRIPEFELATQDAGLYWRSVSLSRAFADWLDTFDDDERKMCLDEPSLVEGYADPGFIEFLVNRTTAMIDAAPNAERDKTVFAVTGLMELYDFVHVSALIEKLPATTPGIVLLFFPGEREGNTYRFLGARTGWDYLAVPILAEG
jgi:hypothetical protein